MKKLLIFLLLFTSLSANSQLTPIATYLKTKKQAVSSGTSYIVLFDNTEIPDGAAPQPNTYTFKAPIAGLYKIETAISVSGGSPNSSILLYIDKSNSSTLRQQYCYFTHAADRTANLVTDMAFKAGESISLRLYTNGAALTISENSHMIISRYSGR